MKIYNLLLILAIAGATAASPTCQKADYCPSTLCACNGACYSEDQYCCLNGQLTQKAFCSSSPVATTSSSSVSCTPVSIVPQSSCASSNPARDLQCCTSDGYGYANGSFCGSFHQCSGGVCFLTGKDGENCASASSSPAATSAPATSSSSSSSTCQKASYCASSLCACNGACYSEDQYCCPNGQLTQKAFCSSSPVATSSSSSDSCTPVSIVPQSSCASSNSARDLQCCTSDGYGYANGSFCGTRHQCSGGICFLTGKDGENCAFSASSPATSAAATSAAATSAVATAPSGTQACTPYSIIPLSSCAESNPARDLECCTSDGYGLSNGSYCGTLHQCFNGYCGLTGYPGENCDSPSPSSASSSSSSSSSCQKADYCGSSLCACNGACYSEDQYCCPNGQLTQKAFCSSSSPVATASSSQQAVVKTTDGSTLTLVNKCAYTISLCSTYGGPLFDLAAGQNATNQPSGPYNECGSVQAEVTLNASNSQSCYDLSEVAYKQSKNPITIYSSTGPTLTCQTSPCSDASQPGGSYQVKCTSAPTSIVIQWC